MMGIKQMINGVCLYISIGLVTSQIYINEVEVTDAKGEFIELFNNGSSNVDVSDYKIVLFDGSVIPAAKHKSYNLKGTIKAGSYMIVKNKKVESPKKIPSVIMPGTANLLPDGPAAVALYTGSAPETATSDGLVDVLLYTKAGEEYNSSAFFPHFMEEEIPIAEVDTTPKTSLSRCDYTPLRMTSYTGQGITPGTENPTCTPVYSDWELAEPCNATGPFEGEGIEIWSQHCIRGECDFVVDYLYNVCVNPAVYSEWMLEEPCNVTGTEELEGVETWTRECVTGGCLVENLTRVDECINDCVMVNGTYNDTSCYPVTETPWHLRTLTMGLPSFIIMVAVLGGCCVAMVILVVCMACFVRKHKDGNKGTAPSTKPEDAVYSEVTSFNQMAKKNKDILSY